MNRLTYVIYSKHKSLIYIVRETKCSFLHFLNFVKAITADAFNIDNYGYELQFALTIGAINRFT